MKLISMTSFVEEQEKIILDEIEYAGSSSEDYKAMVQFITYVTNYTKFLRQPLTLGMFVPVDEEGNVLEEPKGFKEWHKWGVSSKLEHSEIIECQKYWKAKEKALFEGFQVPDDEWYKGTKTVMNKELGIILYLDTNQISINGALGIGCGEVNTVEDLCQYDLQLTPSSLKQIGL